MSHRELRPDTMADPHLRALITEATAFITCPFRQAKDPGSDRFDSLAT